MLRVGAPKATPAEIVEKLNEEINLGLADPKMKGRLAELGGMVLAGSETASQARYSVTSARRTRSRRRVLPISC